MRKLKTSEKRKWIVNGLLAFGAVALLTTGFATWIVGVNQREANGGVNVQVDTAQKNNVSFTFEVLESNKDIYVGEKTSSSSDNFVNITGNDEKDTDFTVGIKITIEVGADVANKPTKVALAINYDGEGLAAETDNTAATGNKVTYKDSPVEGDGSIKTPKTHAAGDYKYIDINNELAEYLKLPKASGNGWTIAEKDGDTKYEYINAEVKMFKWGSYFGGKSPSEFYNDLYNAGTLTNSSDDVNLVYNQLQTMKSVFMEKTGDTDDETSWTPRTLNVLATLE